MCLISTILTLITMRNGESSIPFACQDASAVCEHNERVEFGGKYRPFVSTHGNAEYPVRKPSIFSCGFRDGFFKKINLDFVVLLYFCISWIFWYSALCFHSSLKQWNVSKPFF